MTEFLEQLAFVPIVQRPCETTTRPLVIGGMGGSALAGDALAYLLPERDISVHRGYGVPSFASPDALYIAISHSGNTEETISFANEAMRSGCALAVVAGGGKLAAFAEREGLPFVSVPQAYAPRYSLIYLVRALLAHLGESALLEELEHLSIDGEALDGAAEEDAHFFLPSVPLFYASDKNAILARLGKILLNETAHMPAFANSFPELNHNEMQAFDADMPEGLEHLFRFVLLRDGADDPRIERRMDAFTSLMEERGKTVHAIELPGVRTLALVTTWMRFIGAARLLAEGRGIDPETVPLIEAFKKLL